MERNELQQLIHKYLRGTASIAERERLLEWYRQDTNENLEWESQNPNEEQLVHDRIKEKIWFTLNKEKGITKEKKRPLAYASVAALCLAILGISLWKSANDSTGTLITASPKEQSENRFVLLADSSRVVLRPGSRLEYKTDFKGKTREVSLVGEAYFDIRNVENQPFIIHTGKVKTCVLGTAFTIRALEGKAVTVMVQRGKVRIEEEEKTLAELTENQQIEVHKAEKHALKQDVAVAENAFDWTAKDMRFDAQAFGELTSKLERRYDVQIRFKTPDLAKCPISGKFNGLETLEEVLDFLCTTRGAVFKRQGQIVEIDGKGCS